MSRRDALTRRSFLSFPASAVFAATGPSGAEAYRFSFDHIIGTSLDLVVWTPLRRAAEQAKSAVLAEVHRLCAILDTRDPASEISRLERSEDLPSAELTDVLDAYADWSRRTRGVFSIRPRGETTARNVDALGKAYITERAAAAAATVTGISGVLLNIGGDIVARGRPCTVALADPAGPYDNGRPITRIHLHNAAVATSGSYARGLHLLDGRTGRPAISGASASVVAPDAMTANALATSLCLTDADEGLRLVEQTPPAEAIHIARDGVLRRTPGFWRLERPLVPVAEPSVARWPAGYELSLSLTLTAGQDSGRGRRGFHRPYVAVWIETASGTLTRVLAFWVSEERFYDELSTFWSVANRNRYPLAAIARATRAPGQYQLVWDGLDDDRRPVPPGSYRVIVETNQERGIYGKQAGIINCAEAPATLMLPATANFEPVSIQYGPKTSRT